MPSRKKILLVANGDQRQSANEVCWPAQRAMEQALTAALAQLGYDLVRAHPYDPARRHGFIQSQKEGMAVFAQLDPRTPLIVAEAVWQYSHHLLHGLISHRGPILTVANWSGTWPGLVGMLNLNGSLTKAGVKYSTLWSEDFTDQPFLKNLAAWLQHGRRPAQNRPRQTPRALPRSRPRPRHRPKNRRRPAPPQSHHGRLRRGLHGHV